MKNCQGLVTFVPDPFLALYFKKLYEKNFKDEIDGLLVYVNGYRNEVVDFIVDLFKDEFVMWQYSHSNQGQAFDLLYQSFDAKVLMTLCSDNFIYKKGLVKELLEKIKDYDVVGSTGLHIRPPEMADKVARKIGFCRINPFMSFWRADKLKEIEPFSFQSRIMKKGEEILDMKFEPEGWMDCMSDMTVKFMLNGNKAYTFEADNMPNWIHASGLSSGVYGHLRHSDGKNLAGSTREHYTDRMNAGHLSWLLHIYEVTNEEVPLDEFKREYKNALLEKINYCGYDIKTIKEWKKKWENLLNQ